MDLGDQGEGPVDLHVLNEQAVNALVRARAHLGLEHRIDFAQLLKQATGGQGPDVSSYNRWEDGRRRVPAWALILAARVVSQRSGEPISVSQLLEESEGEGKPQPEHVARLARIERDMTELTKLVYSELQRRGNRRRPAAS